MKKTITILTGFFILMIFFSMAAHAEEGDTKVYILAPRGGYHGVYLPHPKDYSDTHQFTDPYTWPESHGPYQRYPGNDYDTTHQFTSPYGWPGNNGSQRASENFFDANNPHAKPENYPDHYPLPQAYPKHTSNTSPNGYWSVERIWIAPVYEKTWVPGYYNQHHEWIPSRYEHLERHKGYWKESKLWVPY